MDPIGVLITGIRTIAGALIPPLKKKYFDQPKIYIVFTGAAQASRFPGRTSPKNDLSKPLNSFTQIRFDKLQWRYNMVFRNNSDHAAYNIRLLSPEQTSLFTIDKKIDKLLPLVQNAELVHKVIFETEVEGTGFETDAASKTSPDFLKSNKFVLEYTNVKEKKFYTVFDGSKEEHFRNEFLKSL